MSEEGEHSNKRSTQNPHLANLYLKLHYLARVYIIGALGIVGDQIMEGEVLIEPISVIDAAEVEKGDKGAEKNKHKERGV